jgi:hypothetical protein
MPGQPGGSLANQLLRENALRQAGQDGGEANVRAVRAWALVHGLAMLMLDGQIPIDLALIERAID